MSQITIANKLNVIPPNSILLPGCEPSSTVSSTVLYQEMLKAGVCNCAIVDVDLALAAIPGSYIQLLDNFGGPTHKYFVLPATIQDCPVNSHGDWYAMLRAICRTPTEDEIQTITNCSVNNQGFFHGPYGSSQT